MPDVDDFIARMRAEREDPLREAREAALREDARRRRRTKALVAGGFAAVALGLAAWFMSATEGERPADEPYAAVALEESLWPDEWPLTTEMPFRGSPTFGWRGEQSGIEIPPAAAVPGVTLIQVDDAMRQVRALLVAANLDPEVLAGGRPDAALALLDPRHPSYARLVARLDAPSREADPTAMFSRFDPRELAVMPIDKGPRLKGTLYFAAGSSPGQVLVRADVTFVYAVRSTAPGGRPGPVPDSEEATRAIVRRQALFAVHTRPAPGVTVGKLVPLEYRAHLGNQDCTTGDGFLHPYFWRQAPKDRPGPAVDPYDRTGPMPAAVCGPDTRR